MVKPREHLFFNNLPDFEKEAEAEKRRAKMPKAPSFSLDDMEEARQVAYNKGMEAGLQKAKESIEQDTEILVQSLTPQITSLENAETARHDLAIENAIGLSVKALSNLLPQLLDTHGENLVKESLKRFFEDHIPKGDLTLFVHPSMVDAVEKYAQSLSPTLKIETNDALTNVQSRLEWADGQYKFTPDSMVSEILALFSQHLPQGVEPILDDSTKTPHTKENNIDQQES